MEFVLSGGAAGVGPGALERDLAALRAELPGLKVRLGVGELAGALDSGQWRDPGFDFWAFDRRMDALVASGQPLVLAAAWQDLPRLALEVGTRCQRLLGRRNEASSGAVFDRALARHRAAHALDRPLARADYDHSLDVWQWVLRLDPGASLAVQLAALFHDVERLVSGAEARSEPGAQGYDRYKDEHARRGSRIAGEWLAEVGVEDRARVEELIAGHEGGGDGDRMLLADADALSFFSFNSPGYVDYFGSAAAERKVAWTLGRLSPGARRYLETIHLRPDVARMLAAAAAAEGAVPAPLGREVGAGAWA